MGEIGRRQLLRRCLRGHQIRRWSAEANELHDLLVERNLALLALQSELTRALRADSGQPDILADEEMRQELLLCLDVADAELQLAEGLRNLRQAARVPISPKPEY